MRSVIIAVFLVSSFFAQAASVESQIQLQVSQVVVVPTDLDSNACLENGISGPRVRFRTNIKWTGRGNLIPLYANLEFENSQLKGRYNELLMPISSKDNLAYMFGVDQNFLSPDKTYFADSCYFDFGNLPSPRNQLTGADQLIVKAKLTLVGYVAVEGLGEPLVFEKSVPAEITYVAGSTTN